MGMFPFLILLELTFSTFILYTELLNSLYCFIVR